MKQAFNILSNRAMAAFTTFFTAASKQPDPATLSRHILALNTKETTVDIITEMAACLKNTLGYRLFAFVVQKPKGVDAWLDPRMYKHAMEPIIISDFNLSHAREVNYLNQNFTPDEHHMDMELTHLIHYELKGKNYRARLYMIPAQEFTPSHDKTINLLLQGCATALAKQIKIDALRDAVVVDPLTQCYNRREFETQLRRHMSTARRHGSKLSLFMFDLDHFKSVNDTHGHLGGDKVLREVAALVKINMRKGDILARYGGEEFIAILPETDKAKAAELADRLREKIANHPIHHHQASIRVTASFGVAELAGSNDMAAFIERADTMLYKAKLNGRNMVMPGVLRVFDPNAAPLVPKIQG